MGGFHAHASQTAVGLGPGHKCLRSIGSLWKLVHRHADPITPQDMETGALMTARSASAFTQSRIRHLARTVTRFKVSGAG